MADLQEEIRKLGEIHPQSISSSLSVDAEKKTAIQTYIRNKLFECNAEKDDTTALAPILQEFRAELLYLQEAVNAQNSSSLKGLLAAVNKCLEQIPLANRGSAATATILPSILPLPEKTTAAKQSAGLPEPRKEAASGTPDPWDQAKLAALNFQAFAKKLNIEELYFLFNDTFDGHEKPAVPGQKKIQGFLADCQETIAKKSRLGSPAKIKIWNLSAN